MNVYAWDLRLWQINRNLHVWKVWEPSRTGSSSAGCILQDTLGFCRSRRGPLRISEDPALQVQGNVESMGMLAKVVDKGSIKPDLSELQYFSCL